MFSRSSTVYRYMVDYFPYEDGKLITSDMFSCILSDLKKEILKYEKYIQDTIKNKDLIISMNNSIEDKLEALNNLNSYIDEYTESKTDLLWASDVISTFYGMSDFNNIYAGIEWNPNYNEGE